LSSLIDNYSRPEVPQHWPAARTVEVYREGDLRSQKQSQHHSAADMKTVAVCTTSFFATVLPVFASVLIPGIIHDSTYPPDLFFAQLLTGEHISSSNMAHSNEEREIFRFGAQMQNFVYLVGDHRTGECVVFDGGWDPQGIREIVRSAGMNLVAFIATHEHWDHIGRRALRGQTRVPGARDFVVEDGIPFFISEHAVDTAVMQAQIPHESIRPLKDGQVLQVGGFDLRFVLTQGHSLGSMVTLVAESPSKKNPDAMAENIMMLTGDTLFPGSCGRLDLKGSSVETMYHTLQKLRQYPDALEIWPGHGYSAAKSTIGQEKYRGLLRSMSKEEWIRRMG